MEDGRLLETDEVPCVLVWNGCITRIGLFRNFQDLVKDRAENLNLCEPKIKFFLSLVLSRREMNYFQKSPET